jgi:hypothetical protein
MGRRAIVGVVLAMSLSAPAYYRAPPPCNQSTAFFDKVQSINQQLGNKISVQIFDFFSVTLCSEFSVKWIAWFKRLRSRRRT